MKSLCLRLILAVTLLFVSTATSSAATVYLPDGYVGHTRLLPVIAHRIFPPYLGQHVYLRPLPPVRGPFAFAPFPGPMPPFGPAAFAW